MNPFGLAEDLKLLQDSDLARMAVEGGTAPSYLILAEIKRRENIRNSEMSQRQEPPSVMAEAPQQLMAGQQPRGFQSGGAVFNEYMRRMYDYTKNIPVLREMGGELPTFPAPMDFVNTNRALWQNKLPNVTEEQLQFPPPPVSIDEGASIRGEGTQPKAPPSRGLIDGVEVLPPGSQDALPEQRMPPISVSASALGPDRASVKFSYKPIDINQAAGSIKAAQELLGPAVGEGVPDKVSFQSAYDELRQAVPYEDDSLNELRQGLEKGRLTKDDIKKQVMLSVGLSMMGSKGNFAQAVSEGGLAGLSQYGRLRQQNRDIDDELAKYAAMSAKEKRQYDRDIRRDALSIVKNAEVERRAAARQNAMDRRAAGNIGMQVWQVDQTNQRAAQNQQDMFERQMALLRERNAGRDDGETAPTFTTAEIKHANEMRASVETLLDNGDAERYARTHAYYEQNYPRMFDIIFHGLPRPTEFTTQQLGRNK